MGPCRARRAVTSSWTWSGGTRGLSSSTGAADHSAEAVRHRIRQLIDAEPAADILSDDTIAQMLQKEQGIEVAANAVVPFA